MLTKPGEAGLVLSKDAEKQREAAQSAVASFQEAATGESLVNADPRATALAVYAQLCSEQADLLEAGATLLQIAVLLSILCWLGTSLTLLGSPVTLL